MNKERLQEIKDSIDFQSVVAKTFGITDEILKEEKELYDEVVRLGNVINELEKYIKAEIPEEEFVNSEWYVNILDKLKELKEVDK